MALQGTANIIAAIKNDPTIVKEARVSTEVSEYLMHQSKLDLSTMEKHIRHSLIEEMVQKLEEEGLLNMSEQSVDGSMDKRFTCSLFVVDLF